MPAIYLDANGVTIKASVNAVIGESYELGDISYLVVDEATLKAMVAADEDVTKVVTTNVTDMTYMHMLPLSIKTLVLGMLVMLQI